MPNAIWRMSILIPFGGPVDLYPVMHDPQFQWISRIEDFPALLHWQPPLFAFSPKSLGNSLAMYRDEQVNANRFKSDLLPTAQDANGSGHLHRRLVWRAGHQRRHTPKHLIFMKFHFIPPG